MGMGKFGFEAKIQFLWDKKIMKFYIILLQYKYNMLLKKGETWESNKVENQWNQLSLKAYSYKL